MDLRSGTIKPYSPFSFEQCLSYIQSVPGSENDHNIAKNQFIKAFSFREKTYAVQIINKGNLEDPQFKVTLMAREKMKDHELEHAIQKIRFYFGVDEYIQDFYEIGNQDKMFKPLINNLYGHRMIKFLTVFEAAVWTLLNSSLTQKEAISHKKTLQRRLGNMININGINYYAFPRPTDLIESPTDAFQQALPQQRIRQRIYDIATYFADIDDPDYFSQLTNDEVKDELLHLEGIDQADSLFILNFGIGRLNEIHYSDPKLVHAVEKTYGTHYEVNQETIEQIASHYEEWKAYWAHYLRISHT